MKSKQSFSLNVIAEDIYKWVSPIDNDILKNPTYDFYMLEKLKQWKQVKPLDSLDKSDVQSFFLGKFQPKCFKLVSINEYLRKYSLDTNVSIH